MTGRAPASPYTSRIESPRTSIETTITRRSQHAPTNSEFAPFFRALLAAEIRPLFAASKIALNVDVEESEQCRIRSFPMDVEAVLVNLLTNAHAACLRTSRTRKVHLEVRPSTNGGQNFVALIVGDTGPGIPREMRSKIWVPLYTTKTSTNAQQEGIGLGLSIVESIVTDHGGHRSVSVDKRLGGARFEILFPVTRRETTR